MDLLDALPDLRLATDRAELPPLRTVALTGLADFIEARLTAGPFAAPTALEDLSFRHLAKAAGTTRSALSLMDDARWTDACILTRAVFEQLFTYLWIVQDVSRAEIRSVMVTIKQEWANAKYLEGLASGAPPEAQAELLNEAERYKQVADALLARLAAELGTTEKKVRDEAKLRVSAKAVEVNLGPAYSVPYAHYSGFVHSDGVALAAYGGPTPEGMRYSLKGAAPEVPLTSDLHRGLLRMAIEVRSRCERFAWEGAEGLFEAHSRWLEAADAHERGLA
jgi:hypothetical protein